MLPELLAEAAARFGDRAAYVAGQDFLTYARWHERSDAAAAELVGRGVRPGDVVALTLPTGVDYPVCYLAAAKAGAITAGINPRLTSAEQVTLLDVVRPALVVDEAAAAGLRAVASAPAPVVDADPDRALAVVFTSGTTGTPKAAVFGSYQLSFIRDTDVGPGWGAGGSSLFATSLTHLGFMTKIAGHIQNGATAHLVPRWRPADALRRTAELGLTAVTGVPTQFALLLASPVLDAVDLSSVRTVVMGGGTATPALVRAVRERFGVPVVVRYSCTEAGIGLGTRPDDPPEDAEETVGRPQPGVELRVVDDEVQLRSPAVMTGYHRNPAATAEALTDDGFVRTGDLGSVDDGGRLRLHGRRSEMWVRGGYNVFPAEVEAVLAEHPQVQAVAAGPRSDDVMGEVCVAYVVPRGTAPTLDELRAYAGERLASYKLPERLVVLDALPLTAGDKVDRRRLREL